MILPPSHHVTHDNVDISAGVCYKCSTCCVDSICDHYRRILFPVALLVVRRINPVSSTELDYLHSAYRVGGRGAMRQELVREGFVD